MLKTINPNDTFTWASPLEPETVFTYKAFTGVHMSFDADAVFNKAVDVCILKVTNIQVDVPILDTDGNPTDTTELKEFKEFIPSEWPTVKMSKILPQSMATALFAKIYSVSAVSKKESGE